MSGMSERIGRSEREGARQRRARRALERQLDYQWTKALAIEGREESLIASMRERSAWVRARLERVRPVPEDARVVEVGSGAHGLVFFFASTRAVGVDPLAWQYASLFPAWQRRVPTVAAAGERLPFPDASIDVALCDNVVDHAEDPARIVREIARVLAPGGLLYFTVNFHHPLYAAVSALHAAWNAAGLRVEIGPFADHTVHLTLGGARGLFRGLPLRVEHEAHDVAAARADARARVPRHAGDRLKRLFFKNALYEAILVREA